MLHANDRTRNHWNRFWTLKPCDEALLVIRLNWITFNSTNIYEIDVRWTPSTLNALSTKHWVRAVLWFLNGCLYDMIACYFNGTFGKKNSIFLFLQIDQCLLRACTLNIQPPNSNWTNIIEKKSILVCCWSYQNKAHSWRVSRFIILSKLAFRFDFICLFKIMLLKRNVMRNCRT